jgi:hypothetical protein
MTPAVGSYSYFGQRTARSERGDPRGKPLQPGQGWTLVGPLRLLVRGPHPGLWQAGLRPSRRDHYTRFSITMIWKIAVAGTPRIDRLTNRG